MMFIIDDFSSLVISEVHSHEGKAGCFTLCYIPHVSTNRSECASTLSKHICQSKGASVSACWFVCTAAIKLLDHHSS